MFYNISIKGKMNNRYLTREELLDAQLAMLKEIHRCCVDNGLTYYLAYGTLIGAIRHKGFIPWDDDVDIMMPLHDYEKLRVLYKSDRYFIADCFLDRRHQLPFPRIYDGRTCMGDNDSSLGVSIDIYIMHGAPNSQKKRAEHALEIMNLTKTYFLFSHLRSIMARHLFPFLWNQNESRLCTFFCKRLFQLLSKYKSEESKVLYPYSGEGLTDLIWKDFFDGITLVDFNGEQFYAPQRYHDVLSTTYGNYLKLPPEEDRHPYHGSEFYSWKSNMMF